MKKGIQAMVLTCLASLVACVFVRAPTAEELALLDNPPVEVKTKQERIAPLALQWLNDIEAELLPNGRGLSESEMSMAQTAGVKHPDRVRILVQSRFPLPDEEPLRTEAMKFGFGNNAEGARTMGYVIMLKEKYAREHWILAHELVHVAQQERMGRDAFIRRLIAELELMGYRRAPLELEANKLAMEFM